MTELNGTSVGYPRDTIRKVELQNLYPLLNAAATAALLEGGAPGNTDFYWMPTHEEASVCELWLRSLSEEDRLRFEEGDQTFVLEASTDEEPDPLLPSAVAETVVAKMGGYI